MDILQNIDKISYRDEYGISTGLPLPHLAFSFNGKIQDETWALFHHFWPFQLLHCSHWPREPNFVQNGDPMGTQFLVRWGPNEDLRQQEWGPKSVFLKIDRNKLIS